MKCNTDSVRRAKIKPTKKSNPCPICNNITGHCKYSPLNEIILCHNFDIDVSGYKFVKKTRGGHWGVFVPERDYKATLDPETVLLMAERELERKRLQEQKQALSLSDSERHIEHTKLIDQLSLSFGDESDLKRRGLTDEQIKKGGFVSVKQWQKLREYVNPNLAGVNVSGKGLTNFHDGLLCFAKNPKGEITGYQIRVTDGTPDKKYIWATSKANDNRGIDATVHLKETGELPLTCEFINPEDKDLKLCEGILKPKVAAYRHNQNYLGASGGNFTASPETFASYVNAKNPERIIFCPDKGSLNNPQVLNNWRRTRDFLVNLGYDVYVEIWEGANKFDVDEYPEGSLTKIIPYLEWDTDYRTIADIETPQKEILKTWLNGKNFTPNLTVSQQFLTNPSLKLPWKEGDTYFIKSGLGTGKTTWLINELKGIENIRKFAFGKINNLLLQFCAKDGTFYHYQEDEGQLLKSDINTNFALCINSLIHFEDEAFDGSIIIIDEVVSVVKQLYSSFLGARQNRVIQKFEQAMRRAAIVVCTDGTLDDKTADFIMRLRGKTDNVYKALNEHKPQTFNMKFMQVTDTDSGKILDKEISGVFKKILTHNKPVFVTITSQKKAKELDVMADKRGKKVFRLDSETSTGSDAKIFLADPNNYIETEKPDLVIISPSGGEGLDISIKCYFETAYHIGNCLDADTNFQMISRLRDAKVPRYLYVVKKGFKFNEISSESYQELKMYHEQLLHDDLLALSDKKYLLELRKRQRIYTETSPHFEMSTLLIRQSNIEVGNLRDCLMLMLQKAGHKISFVEVNDDKEIKAEIKEVKETILQEEITQVFNADDIPDSVGNRWTNNSQGLTKEQRYQLRKWKYKQILPGISDTPYWDIALIEMLIKKPNLISQLTLGYFFRNPEKIRQLTEFKLIKRLEQEEITYLKAEPSYYQKVKFLKKCGIELLIEENDGLINPDDDWVNIIYEKCNERKAKHLGFGQVGNDKMKTVNKLLKNMGLRTERKHSHQDGVRVVRYQVLPLSDLEQALTDAIERRIEEQLEKESQRLNNPVEDCVKWERVDITEDEPDTHIDIPFYKNKTETSVSATPPTGSKIELSLPPDFYLKNSLVFDLVNGRSWQIVEYVQIHGEDYVELSGESGDKVRIPLDWVLYCCNCVQ